jgi:hypothetical protein
MSRRFRCAAVGTDTAQENQTAPLAATVRIRVGRCSDAATVYPTPIAARR